MRKSARGAFTLVELLVVITIIGMLMAMVFPALGAFLAKVDQTRCENVQSEIAKSIGTYVNAKTIYPGYVNRIVSGGRGGSRQPALKSWIVATLEIYEKDKFDAIRNGLPTAPVELSRFTCPANPREGEMIGIVANCGRKDASSGGGNIPPDWKTNGVFMRQALQTGGGTRDEKVRATDIQDGESKTLLISENLQATKWTAINEPDIGMIWVADGPSPDVPNKDSMKINIERDVPITTGDYNYARPSSNHPEGVVVAFCDGTTRFLSDKVDYGGVYCKLMTPDGKNCKEPGQNAPSKQFFRDPFNDQLMDP
jgi:prepilin-type N-terminal cleavage/methylation domain-containing protein